MGGQPADESSVSFSRLVIDLGALPTDLSVGACQGADVTHLGDGLHKGIEENILVSRICCHQFRVVSVGHGQYFVRVQNSLPIQKILEVLVVEYVRCHIIKLDRFRRGVRSILGARRLQFLQKLWGNVGVWLFRCTLVEQSFRDRAAVGFADGVSTCKSSSRTI